MFPWTSTRWPACPNPIQPQRIRDALLWLRSRFKLMRGVPFSFLMPHSCSTITLEECYAELIRENHMQTNPVQSPVLDPSCLSWSRSSDPPVGQGLLFSNPTIQTTHVQPDTKQNVVINIIEMDKVTNSLTIIGKWRGSFCLCVLFLRSLCTDNIPFGQVYRLLE